LALVQRELFDVPSYKLPDRFVVGVPEEGFLLLYLHTDLIPNIGKTRVFAALQAVFERLEIPYGLPSQSVRRMLGYLSDNVLGVGSHGKP
jgi:hypothetical protein